MRDNDPGLIAVCAAVAILAVSAVAALALAVALVAVAGMILVGAIVGAAALARHISRVQLAGRDHQAADLAEQIVRRLLAERADLTALPRVREGTSQVRR